MLFLFQEGITQGPGSGTWADYTIEILVMLLVAFLLGLLLGYLLWYRYRSMYVKLEEENGRLHSKLTDLEKDHASLKYKYDELEKDNKAHRSKIRSLEADNSILAGKLEKLEASLTADAGVFGAAAASLTEANEPAIAAAITPDDLKKIEGVGPKIEGLLNDGGIYTFKTLATTAVERLQEILDAAGPRYRIHNPSTWSKQAELADAGKWEELKEYQDFLQGGKDPA